MSTPPAQPEEDLNMFWAGRPVYRTQPFGQGTLRSSPRPFEYRSAMIDELHGNASSSSSPYGGGGGGGGEESGGAIPPSPPSQPTSSIRVALQNDLVDFIDLQDIVEFAPNTLSEQGGRASERAS